MLALAWMLWLTARGERERDPLLRAWHALGARYARLGLGRAPHEPAGEWARARGRAHARASTLPALSARFADWRYAHGDGRTQGRPDRERHDLVRDLRRHRP